MPVAREIELKLRIAPAHAPRLLRHPLLRELRSAPARTARMVSVYFDTDDARLAHAGIALRVRRDGRRWIQTLKGPPESGSGAGVASRLELEDDRGAGTQPPPLDPARWPDTPWRGTLAEAHAQGLEPRFATDFRRTRVPIALRDGSRAILCVDVGEIRDRAGRRVPVAEMEIELVHGGLEGLYELALALARDVPLAVEPRSKADRGYALVSGARPEPVRADNPPLDEHDSAAAALQTLLRACTRQIADNADGMRTDDDPEWIHQLRIGTRRLRACTALLRDTVAEERRAAIAADAQWLARALGPARDLDVLAEETLPALTVGLRERADRDGLRVVAALARKLDPARVEAREAARAAVASPRFTRLLLAVGALAAAPRLGAAEGSAAARKLLRSAQRFASPWLAQRHRQLLKRARGLAHATTEERHAVRIAAKRLRYVTEFFAGVFPRKRVRRYRGALQRLQDELGAQMDHVVATRLALAIEGPGSAAARLLQEDLARQAAATAGATLRRWRAFRACNPFF